MDWEADFRKLRAFSPGFLNSGPPGWFSQGLFEEFESSLYTRRKRYP